MGEYILDVLVDRHANFIVIEDLICIEKEAVQSLLILFQTLPTRRESMYEGSQEDLLKSLQNRHVFFDKFFMSNANEL